MEKEMEKEKNIMKKEVQYSKVNIQMEREMEEERNIIQIILMKKDGMVQDIILKEKKILNQNMAKEKEKNMIMMVI